MDDRREHLTADVLADLPPHPDRLHPDEPRYSDVLRAHRAAVLASREQYVDPLSGLSVFTAAHHAARGTCCDSGCRHCLWVT